MGDGSREIMKLRSFREESNKCGGTCAALGGLASPFGLFNHAELVRKHWNGLGLETDWKADLSGCAQGLAVVETAPGVKELVVDGTDDLGQGDL